MPVCAVGPTSSGVPTPGDLYETARALEARAARKDLWAQELRRRALGLPTGAVIAAGLIEESMWGGDAADHTRQALRDRLNPLHAAADDLSHVARGLDAEADALRDQARHLRRQADTLESWGPRSP